MQDARKQKRSAQMKIIDAKRVGVRTRTQDKKKQKRCKKKTIVPAVNTLPDVKEQF